MDRPIYKIKSIILSYYEWTDDISENDVLN